jgi:hypothetical protein
MGQPVAACSLGDETGSMRQAPSPPAPALPCRVRRRKALRKPAHLHGGYSKSSRHMLREGLQQSEAAGRRAMGAGRPACPGTPWPQKGSKDMLIIP